jgi:hypothetical protein
VELLLENLLLGHPLKVLLLLLCFHSCVLRPLRGYEVIKFWSLKKS